MRRREITVIRIRHHGRVPKDWILIGKVALGDVADFLYEEICKSHSIKSHTVRIAGTGPTAGQISVVHNGEVIATGVVRHEESTAD